MKAYIGTLEEIIENVLSSEHLCEVGEMKEIDCDLSKGDNRWIIYYKAKENINLQTETRVKTITIKLDIDDNIE